MNSDLCSGLLEPGKHYNFKVKLNGKASVDVSEVSLVDWDYQETTKIIHTKYNQK